MPYPFAYATTYSLTPSRSQQSDAIHCHWRFASSIFKAATLCSLLALSAMGLNGCYSPMPLKENLISNIANSDLAYDADTAAIINNEAPPATRLTFDYNSRRLINNKTMHGKTSISNNSDTTYPSEINLTQVHPLDNTNADHANAITANNTSYKNRYKPLQYNKYHPAPLNSLATQPTEKPNTQKRPTRYYHDTYYDYDPFYYDQPWRGLRGTYLSPYYYYSHPHGLGGGLYLKLH